MFEAALRLFVSGSRAKTDILRISQGGAGQATAHSIARGGSTIRSAGSPKRITSQQLYTEGAS